MNNLETHADAVIIPLSTLMVDQHMRVREGLVTQERLKELLHYDPDTGIFTANSTRRGLSKGTVVGCYFARDDMMLTTLDGRQYAMQNLAWLYVYGEWPAKQLIKLDGNGRNIAIANLALRTVGTRGDLTQDRLKFVLDYNRETGVFTWLHRPAKNISVGSRAGRRDPNGHVIIVVDCVEYTAQRLAWLYEYGTLPDRPLRFLDGNKQNLTIVNLALPEHDDRTPEGRTAYGRDYRKRRFSVLRAADLRKDFGIQMDVYMRLFEAQGGLCAICKKPETAMRNGKVKWLAVDHDHASGKVRGLLCSAHNQGLGLYGDDPALLRAAADYLEKDHSAAFDGDTVVRLDTPRKAKSRKEAA